MQRSIRDISPNDRRRVLGTTVARLIVTSALFVLIYALLPVEGITTPETIVRLFIALIAFPVILAWQIRTIKSARYPDLRATEAVIGAVSLFVVICQGEVDSVHQN